MAITPTLPSAAGLPVSSDAARLPDVDAGPFKGLDGTRPTSPRRPYQPPPQDIPLLRPASAGLGVEAYEEITFQASEREEAEVHDELHDRHVRDAELIRGALPVEKVMAVMRLIEGGNQFHVLRTQARIFAKDFESDPEGALERIKPANHRPETRFALMRMAEDLIQKAQDQRPELASTLQALRQLEQQDARQIRHLIQVYEATQPELEGKASSPASPLIQLLASPLSTRVLMEAVGSPEGLKTLSRQVGRLPHEGHFDSPATFVGLSVSLAHMLAVVRTMDGHATQLVTAMGLPTAEQPKLLRQLMDMCRTAAPRPKLEKIRSDLLKQVGAQNSLRFDHELLKQVGQYPESVWIHIDAKTAVQTWLREAQGLHYRRQGVLGVTGQLNRDALQIVSPAT